MELEHSFTVPVPKSQAWDVLLDVERIAPCMPGASLDSVEGDEIKGRIKVKVGPISMTYAGTARFTERDLDKGVVTLEASGKETKGSGTASATVRSALEDADGQTKVTVHTTLNVTGKPAQFGRGVMAEVSGKLIGIFADNLAAMLAESGGGPASATPTGAASDGTAPETATSPVTATPVVPPSLADNSDLTAQAHPAEPIPVTATGSPTAVKVPVRHSDEQLNLLKVAGLPLLKRALPVLLGLIAAILIALRKRIFRRSR